MSVDPAEVAARASTENFPIASLLFPRALRPHLRAVYGFARLVDMLGDEWPGDRLAALDELEREVERCYTGEPEWPVLRTLQPTIHAYDLPREPFLRLIEANRMDQRVSQYETWADLKRYCVHSADPVGRLVLGLLRRATEPQLVSWSDDVCTGLQLVNFLQDVPRDLELGRVYLPAEDRRRFGVAELARPNGPLRALMGFETDRARGLLASGEPLGAALGGRVGRAVALFARGGLAALDQLERLGYDVFSQRPVPPRSRLAWEAIRAALSPFVLHRTNQSFHPNRAVTPAQGAEGGSRGTGDATQAAPGTASGGAGRARGR
jgi:squalene synthase HpnC